MNEIRLFTDGSLDPATKIGYGAYLLITNLPSLADKLAHNIPIKRFEQTTSTQLELQTVLWALSELPSKQDKIFLYTDSQNIINLPARRNKLEAQHYRNKKGELIRNHDLYRTFYACIDQLDCALIKVRGHQPSSNKDLIEQLFGLVDRASRQALRGMDSRL